MQPISPRRRPTAPETRGGSPRTRSPLRPSALWPLWRDPIARLAALLLLVAGCETHAPRELPTDEVAVAVRELGFDPRAGGPVLLLGEVDGSRQVAIWIGFAEARSIAAELESFTPPRPNGHDLTVRLLKDLRGVVERVVVHTLRDGIYYAIIEVRTSEELLRIDARPSDAIAVGLRSNAPLFARSELLRPADAIFSPQPEERSL